MRRRTVLASLGTLTVGFAGCTNTNEGPSGTVTTLETTDTATDTPSGTDTTTGHDTGTPTTDGGQPDSRFAGESCPTLVDSADRTVCWHTTDPASAEQYLEPSAELFEPSTGDDSVETVQFVLHNESGGGVGFNPYAWAVYRQTDGGWEYVAPEAYPEPWYQLEDGGTYTWVLAVEEHPTPYGEQTRYPVVDLADGVYAFEVTASASEGPNSGQQVSCVALFEVSRA